MRHSILVIVIAVLWGCLCAPAAAQAPTGDVAMNALAADAASLDGCQVVARIDGQVVLACEVLWEINKIIELQQDRIPPDQMEPVRRQLLQRKVGELLDYKLIYADFLRTFPVQNLPKLEEDLRKPFEEDEVPRLMKVLGVDDRRALELELVRLGSSLDDLRRAFNEKAIVSQWVREQVKINEEVRPDELWEDYQSNLAEYEYPAQVRWEELMVKKDRFATPDKAFAELAKMGNEVWQRAKAAGGVSGPAFVEVAKERSHGYNASEGGQHDWIAKGALKDAAIDEALFTLQVGQMSHILESETGFHIVRVLERKEAGRRPFTEVQGEIREKLKEERRKEAMTAYLERLRRNARIWTAFHGNISADVLLGRPPSTTQQR